MRIFICTVLALCIIQDNSATPVPTSLPSSVPSGEPSGEPTSIPSIMPTCPTSIPSREPTGQPSSVPSTVYSTIYDSDYMIDCYSSCTYTGAPAVSTWAETEFCAFYADTTGANEATVRAYSVVPTCLNDCPAAYCKSFSIFSRQCGNTNPNNKTEMDSIYNECLDSYNASNPNNTAVVFNVDIYFSGVNETEFDNPVARDAVAHAVLNSMRRNSVMTASFVSVTYRDFYRRLADDGSDGAGTDRRRLLGITVVEIQIATVLSALGYSDGQILLAFADLRREIEAAVTGSEMTTLFQQYAAANGYTPISSLGIEGYVGIDANFVPLPTSVPTTPAPTGVPSSFPTAMPSYSLSPTVVLRHVEVTGNITVDRNESDVCTATELRLHIAFNRDLVQEDEGTYLSIYVDLPGFTNGPCIEPRNGFDFYPVGYSNTSAVKLLYYEGNHSRMFRDSQLRIYMQAGEWINYNADTNIEIVIDKDQGIRFHCMQDTTFQVTMRTIRSNNFYVSRGAVDFLSFIPRYCFIYNSSLAFYPAKEQTFTSINFTLQLATDFKYGDNITLYLPGFTNGAAHSASYDTVRSWGRTSASGSDAALVGLSGGGRAWSRWNRHGRVQWRGRWVEGTYSTSDMFGGSYLTIWIEPQSDVNDAAHTFIPAGDKFYVLIDRENRLSTYCGRPGNYEGFTVSVQSRNTTLVVPIQQVDQSDPIGAGCPLANNCSRVLAVCGDRGVCDYCSQQCQCFDGYGSASDRAAVEVDNFPRDCSGRICPFGVSFASLVHPSGASSFAGAHEKTECSSAGICQRSTGECKCFEGFEGAACQRRTCPGGPSCSGRGQCKDMSKLARTYEALPLRNSTAVDRTYYFTDVDGNTWDAQSLMGCVCDSSWPVGLGSGETQLPEYFGPSCEFRRCPSGNDPTSGGVDETDCSGKSQTGGPDLGQAGNLCHHECSGRGLCDYSTGTCTCFPGVEGSNCGTLIT